MRKRIIALLSFFVLFFGFASITYAEKIDSFDVRVTAHKDGLMNVTENINYDFENLDRHGIYRYIPLYSKVGDLYRVLNIKNISVTRDGENEKFETSKNKEQIYFKIGNADKTITGKHIYKINYDVENGIGSNFPDFDEIYWNGTGNDWTVPIVKASIKFANDFDAKQTGIICFTGLTGSKSSECKTESNTAITNVYLSPGMGLTAIAQYPKGTFPPSVLYKELPKTSSEKIGGFIFGNIEFIYLFLNIILPLTLLYWYQKHKNKKRFGPPAVNFDVPKDEKGERIAPALAGTIDSAKLERDDVVATIFDLAIRKYIKMEEIKTTRKLLPDSTRQKIVNLKKESQDLNLFEKTLFDKLFENGDDVYVDDLRKDFYKTYEKIENQVFKTLVEKKYYVKNPKVQRGLLLVLGIFALFTANIFLSGVLIFLSYKLIGRTALGDEIDNKIDGLKLFLKSMDRNYKWQAEKFYTVEQMIPYAISLGYINQFMEQLKVIKPDYNPSWYHGYSGGFYVSYAGFYSSMSSNMTTSAPTSSSGSSGGFSGGGGGGGGGGSW
jgi:uncharacterized membrane protein